LAAVSSISRNGALVYSAGGVFFGHRHNSKNLGLFDGRL
jgi:hypothetical protein